MRYSSGARGRSAAWNPALPVSPFIISPVGRSRNEAGFVFAPEFLARREEELVHKIFRRIRSHCPYSCFTAQVFYFHSRVVICTTIRSSILDSVGKRPGLSVTLGSLVSWRSLLRQGKQFERQLRCFEVFFATTFRASLSRGVDSLVESFQSSQTTPPDVAVLQQIFLDEFYALGAFPVNSGAPSKIGRLLKVVAKPCIKPCSTMEQVLRYWEAFSKWFDSGHPELWS